MACKIGKYYSCSGARDIKTRRQSGSSKLTQNAELRPLVRTPACWWQPSSVLPQAYICVASFSRGINSTDRICHHGGMLRCSLNSDFWPCNPHGLQKGQSGAWSWLSASLCMRCPALCAQLHLQVPCELENEILWDSLSFYSHFIYSCQVNWVLKRHQNLGCFFPPNHWNSQTVDLWRQEGWWYKIKQFIIAVLTLS